MNTTTVPKRALSTRALPPVAARVRPTIRPVRRSDAPALLAFYEGLSPESRHARFLGFVRVDRPTAEWMAAADGIARSGFVAVDPAGDVILGHLCLEPGEPQGHEQDPGQPEQEREQDREASLEIGIAVADGCQGQGIGRELLIAGLAWARARRVPSIYGVALSDNSRILRAAASLGAPCTYAALGDGLVRATVTVDSADAHRQSR